MTKKQECAPRSSPEGDRKALWSLPQERNPCDNQNQHKIISIRKKSRGVASNCSFPIT